MSNQWELLILDDDPEIVEELSDFLDMAGYRCHGATTAQQAQELLASRPGIGIMIVDLCMPSENGLDFIRRQRRERHDARLLEAILLTGHSGEEQIIEALRLGVADYQKKPVDVDALLHAVSRAEQRLNDRRRARAREHQVNELQAQVVRDPLTGLFNRRYLQETLERELARIQRERSVLSVVLLDADHFKSINDRYGHSAGDLMLQTFARVLQCGSRKADVACRYGGEEFAVIMAGANAEEAKQRAEEWRQAIENLEVAYESTRLSMTFSAGIASYPAHGASGPALLRAADDALYAAKAQGRNRICLAEPPQTPA